MRERVPDLSMHGITRARVRELLAFCERYEDKKREMQEVLYESPSPSDGMPKAGSKGNPVHEKAERRDRLFRECAAIEQAAIEACPCAYQDFIKYITKPKQYKISILPYGTTAAYAIRKRFLVILDEKKNTLGT